jgi:hypothetical protein
MDRKQSVGEGDMKKVILLFIGFGVLGFAVGVRADMPIHPSALAPEILARTSLLGRSELRNFSLGQGRETYARARALDSTGFAPDAENLDALIRLLRYWRGSDPALLGSRSLTIQNAPYPDALLAARLPTLWEGLWAETYAAERTRIVENTPLELIFDGLLDGYISGTLPPDLASQAGAIGKCLAKRAVAARSESCPLDPSDATRKVSSVKLAWLKLECGMLNFTKGCKVRQALYDATKADLIEARKSNPALRAMIEAEFEKQFPVQFRESFLATMNEKRGAIGTLISSKFDRASVDAFWGSDARLVEPEERTSDAVTLRSFARGLENEITTAALLQKDPDPTRRGVAASLFYAAANRLLALSGGTKVVWLSEYKSFQPDPAVPFDPALPARAPVLSQVSFGGWGVGMLAGKPGFSAWDWAGYDPLAEDGVESRIRLFPDRWRLGAHGQGTFVGDPQDMTENLGDIADLLSALDVFLNETHPERGAFARFFGPESQAADLLEPGKPLIFPLEGRTLAVGVIAAALKNVIAPKYGHLIVKEQGSPDFGLGIELVEKTDLVHGRRPDLPTSSSAVARVLLAAGALRETLRDDPDVPAELRDLLPRLDEIQQIGSIYLGAKAQLSDGGFTRSLGTNSIGDRVAVDTLESLQALSAAWNKSELLLILVRIHQGWLHLENRWSEIEPLVVAGVPLRELKDRGILTSELWEWLRLWRITQPKIRSKLGPGFSPSIPWDQWEIRMQALEQNLRSVWNPSKTSIL